MAPAHAHAHAHDPAGQLPQGAQQLSVRQVVHQDYWDNHPGFQERLRAHMRAELARTATQQLLHQPRGGGGVRLGRALFSQVGVAVRGPAAPPLHAGQHPARAVLRLASCPCSQMTLQ